LGAMSRRHCQPKILWRLMDLPGKGMESQSDRRPFGREGRRRTTALLRVDRPTRRAIGCARSDREESLIAIPLLIGRAMYPSSPLHRWIGGRDVFTRPRRGLSGSTPSPRRPGGNRGCRARD
jgi:hypothetical protein